MLINKSKKRQIFVIIYSVIVISAIVWFWKHEPFTNITIKDSSPPSYFVISKLTGHLGNTSKSSHDDHKNNLFVANIDACIDAELALKQREQQYIKALRHFKKHTKTTIENEPVAMLAGIPVQLYRKYTLFDQSEKLIHLDFLDSMSSYVADKNQALDRGFNSYNLTLQKHWLNAIDNLDYHRIEELLKKAPKQQFVFGLTDVFSVALIRHPHITAAELKELLRVGLVPTPLTLTQIYHRENRLEILNLLMERANYIPMNTNWIYGYSLDNLLIHALKNNDFAVANFWYQRGVPASIHYLQPNALDAFPTPTSQQRDVADELLIKLLSDIKRPYDDLHTARINQIIADSPTLDFATYQIPKMQIGPITTGEINELLTKLKAEDTIKGVVTEEEYAQCLAIEEFQDYREDHAATISWPPPIQKHLSFVELIPDFTLPVLGFLTEQSVLTNKLFETITDKITEKTLNQKKLYQALDHNRPKNEVIAIADKLTSIPDPLINVLAANARWDLLDYFINRGVNINSTDKDGHGPLFYALGSHQPYRTFGYLAQRGAKPQAPDALIHRAIEVTLRDKKHLTIMQWTAAHMQITQAHLTYFYEVARADQPNYAEVLNILEQKLQP